MTTRRISLLAAVSIASLLPVRDTQVLSTFLGGKLVYERQ